jgi:glycosyltransferase involved in cell wall biosynthesis
MRIVFITTKLNFVTSGASVEELDLKVRAFKELGHEVLVVTMFSSVNVINEPLPYKVIEEYSGSGRQLAIQRHVYRVLKKFESHADIFYIDGQVFLYGAGLYRLLGGKRPICAHFNRELIAWQENVSSEPTKRIKRRIKEAVRFYLEKWLGMPLANRMDALSFTNPYLEQTYQRFGLKTADRSLIVGDAFDYKKFMQKYGVTEQSYRMRLPVQAGNTQADRLTIYYSSRMAPGKGFDTLVEAFSKIQHKERFRMILGAKSIGSASGSLWSGIKAYGSLVSTVL